MSVASNKSSQQLERERIYALHDEQKAESAEREETSYAEDPREWMGVEERAEFDQAQAAADATPQARRERAVAGIYAKATPQPADDDEPHRPALYKAMDAVCDQYPHLATEKGWNEVVSTARDSLETDVVKMRNRFEEENSKETGEALLLRSAAILEKTKKENADRKAVTEMQRQRMKAWGG